jgi:hypothetical protein
MKESKPTERTFQGLRSRNINRIRPVHMAVTASTAVAANVYPNKARSAQSITKATTIHSATGLPSWFSETYGCLSLIVHLSYVYINDENSCNGFTIACHGIVPDRDYGAACNEPKFVVYECQWKK